MRPITLLARALISWFERRNTGSIAGTLALHWAIIFYAVNWVPDFSSPTKESSATAELPLVAFFYDEPSRSHQGDMSAALVTSIPSNVDSIRLPLPEFPEISAVAEDAIVESRAISDISDLEKVERLQAIYVKQISARVRRTLEMGVTGTTTPGPHEECFIHVIQGEHGEVLEVDAADCKRDADQRLLIVAALRAASPLPAPPQGLAKGTYLTLDASSF